MMITCTSCQCANRTHRGYCGQCGVTLQPVCRGCRFVNESHDKFCGGCGSSIVTDARPAATSFAPVSAIAMPAPATSANEIDELFLPVVVSTDDTLPSGGITQSDLDQLFGMGS